MLNIHGQIGELEARDTLLASLAMRVSLLHHACVDIAARRDVLVWPVASNSSESDGHFGCPGVNPCLVGRRKKLQSVASSSDASQSPAIGRTAAMRSALVRSDVEYFMTGGARCVNRCTVGVQLVATRLAVARFGPRVPIRRNRYGRSQTRARSGTGALRSDHRRREQHAAKAAPPIRCPVSGLISMRTWNSVSRSTPSRPSSSSCSASGSVG